MSGGFLLLLLARLLQFFNRTNLAHVLGMVTIHVETEPVDEVSFVQVKRRMNFFEAELHRGMSFTFLLYLVLQEVHSRHRPIKRRGHELR